MSSYTPYTLFSWLFVERRSLIYHCAKSEHVKFYRSKSIQGKFQIQNYTTSEIICTFKKCLGLGNDSLWMNIVNKKRLTRDIFSWWVSLLIWLATLKFNHFTKPYLCWYSCLSNWVNEPFMLDPCIIYLIEVTTGQ